MPSHSKWISIGLILTGLLSLQSPAQTQQLRQLVDSVDEAAELLSARRQLDSLLWGPEVDAQKHEKLFVELWDRLLKTDDKFSVLEQFPFKEILIPTAGNSEQLDLAIRQTAFTDKIQNISKVQWPEFLAQFKADGYRIVQTEWHHSKFKPATTALGARSKVDATLHVLRENPAQRIIIKASLAVQWAKAEDKDAFPAIDTIRVEKLEILDRKAPPAFREVFQIRGTKEKPLMMPLLVQDLNGDGNAEIIAGAQNLVIRNHGKGQFVAEPLLQHQAPLFDAGIVADFSGDTYPDLVMVDDSQHPLLFAGDGKGGFAASPVVMSDIKLTLPKTFTAGDIDGDGDLDLYVANYKYAYRQGQMPSPYYDANDGYPAYLLRNDGNGKFTDITKAAGLAAKRNRRAYSSSFVDLDQDQDLDLVVVSDYAGLDTYLNDGKGHFQDISNSFGMDRHFFGMGHTFGDYNGDGWLDMYVIGMSSTTARRLESLGIGREDKPEHTAMRKAMGYGNRLFLGGPDGFTLAPFNQQLARTGWSWGASSFDFDNDADLDIFVANGHFSGKSTQDYCTAFWRHDIYEESKTDDPARDIMFQAVSRPLRQADISWNGYEHKVLFTHDSKAGFINTAFLMGTAFEYDARGVVSDDLDGDGRVDLLVVEFKAHGLDNNQFTLHVYQNILPDAGNWIGVRLKEMGPGLSPIGARVELTLKNGTKQIRQIVTGDSFSSQHPSTAHFGLGNASEVEQIKVTWPNGQISLLEQPAIGRYHWADAPGGKKSL